MLAILVIAAAVVAMVLLVGVGNRAAELARAQGASDAAALAAATAPDAATAASVGQAVATANGADRAEVQWSEEDNVITATVDVDVASAAGETLTRESAAQSEIDPTGLTPAMRAAVARAEQLMGHELTIVSGRRTRAEQQALWDNRHNNRYPVARPGTSRHELGEAIDIPSAEVPALLAVAAEVGLCQPLPVTDPIHFVWCG